MSEPLHAQPSRAIQSRSPAETGAAFTAMVETHYARLGAFACRLVVSPLGEAK